MAKKRNRRHRALFVEIEIDGKTLLKTTADVMRDVTKYCGGEKNEAYSVNGILTIKTYLK